MTSGSPEVIEAALRVYSGKAIVNSVNGEEKSLTSILPLVKKYGAAVVGLTLGSCLSFRIIIASLLTSNQNTAKSTKGPWRPAGQCAFYALQSLV